MNTATSYIPDSWHPRVKEAVKKLIRKAYIDGKIYQMEQCINHVVKEGKNADRK